MSQQAIDAFMQASKAILSDCIHEVKTIDQQAYEGIAHALNSGAFCEIRCCLSVAGANEVLINLVQTNGERLNLGHIDFEHH